MLAKALCILAATTLTSALATTASARDDTQRLPSLRPRGDETIALPTEGRMLALIDRRPAIAEVKRATQSTLPFNAADVGLSIELTQLSAKLSSVENGGKDSYGLRQLHLDARLPLARDIDLLLTGDTAYMNRRLLAIPATASRGRVMAARAGLGLATSWWSVSARYETLGTKARRRPMHRMAEILGGAPLNREGFAVVASGRHELAARQKFELSLAGRMVRRSRADLAITGAPGADRTNLAADVGLTWVF